MTGRPSYNRAASSHTGDYRPSHPSSLRQQQSSSNGSSEVTPLIRGHGAGPSNSRSTTHPAHDGPCHHGTFSPRPTTPNYPYGRSFDDDDDDDDDTSSPGSGTKIPLLDNAISHLVGHDGWKNWLKKRMRTKRMGQSSELAAEAGINDGVMMYMAYYIPCLKWIRQYKLSFLKGDFVSALTMSSFYLPMALSYAANLAHVPPIHGLYAFVFQPFLYAVFGSCSQMIVGPEAAGSLLVGAAVKSMVDAGEGGEDNEILQAQVCGVITAMSGVIVLIAGLLRQGYLDSVLSRPFLRGFISAIGFVIFVDQLIPELGLAEMASKHNIGHGSSVDKLRFIINNVQKLHVPTVTVAGISFAIIMVCRELKKHLQGRHPSVVFIPDRFLVVIISIILCWKLRWDKLGVEVLGEVKAESGGVFSFQFPFSLEMMPYIRDGLSNAFLIALLGFFESSVAAKSLGGAETIQGMQLSANRELIALGTSNLVGGSFLSVPAFGGYGRSKVNQQTGGKSPMSSVFLSLISLLCIMFLLPYFYYLPKPVLSAMISVVAYSLMEEAPHDIGFFWRIRGWKELALMATIFFTTIFFSLTLGMAIGVGVSLLMVIHHSTRPRIQILGRIPSTNRFESAESGNPDIEFVEGCLIVKIPEPLTFANTGELKSRLRRLEMYGTSSAHPALPRLRSTESNRNIIFDIHGVTSIDGSGTQVLAEIVADYRSRGVRVFFSRGPSPSSRSHVWRLMESSGIVETVGAGRFVNDVEEALRRTEYEESVNC